jgi:hypothetical protein
LHHEGRGGDLNIADSNEKKNRIKLKRQGFWFALDGLRHVPIMRNRQGVERPPNLTCLP